MTEPSSGLRQKHVILLLKLRVNEINWLIFWNAWVWFPSSCHGWCWCEWCLNPTEVYLNSLATNEQCSVLSILNHFLLLAIKLSGLVPMNMWVRDHNLSKSFKKKHEKIQKSIRRWEGEDCITRLHSTKALLLVSTAHSEHLSRQQFFSKTQTGTQDGSFVSMKAWTLHIWMYCLYRALFS